MNTVKANELIQQADRVIHVDFRNLPIPRNTIKAKIIRHALITEGIYTCVVKQDDGTEVKECWLQV